MIFIEKYWHIWIKWCVQRGWVILTDPEALCLQKITQNLLLELVSKFALKHMNRSWKDIVWWPEGKKKDRFRKFSKLTLKPNMLPNISVISAGKEKKQTARVLGQTNQSGVWNLQRDLLCGYCNLLTKLHLCVPKQRQLSFLRIPCKIEKARVWLQKLFDTVTVDQVHFN